VGLLHERRHALRPRERAQGVQARAQDAALPGHFSPHCLRHTYASLLLQAGESPAYVQRQLGHASIQLTVDTYGRWLPLGNKAAVDALDTIADDAQTASGEPSRERSGSKVVAAGGSRAVKSECAQADSNSRPSDS